MKTTSIVFWQNAPSIHQAPLIRSLSCNNRLSVTVIAERNLRRERRSQGWSSFDYGKANLIVAPSEVQRRILLTSHISPETWHIFSGINAYQRTYKTLKKACRTNANIATMVEAGDHRPLTFAAFRRLKYRYLALRFRNRIDLVLAMGQLGVEYFAETGWRTTTVKEFGYFVSDQLTTSSPLKKRTPSSTVKILFVGQHIKRKNIGTLIRTLATMKQLDWEAKIVGDGPLYSKHQNLLNNLKLSKKVRLIQKLDNPDVVRLMQQTDIVVLPSLYDGWGAVISEALTAGARAICSRQCGAASLIGTPSQGAIFDAHVAGNLSHVLRKEILRGPISTSERTENIAWAQNCISSTAASDHLLQLFASRQIQLPPWRPLLQNDGTTKNE